MWDAELVTPTIDVQVNRVLKFTRSHPHPCFCPCFGTGKYCDVPLGLYVVRGDSIVLMGEIDSDKESSMKLDKLTPREFAELPEANPEKVDWDFEG